MTHNVLISRVALVGACCLLLSTHGPAAAQTRIPVSQLIPALVNASAVLARPQPNDPRPQPATPRPGDANTFNFVRALPNNPSASLFNTALGAQATSFTFAAPWVSSLNTASSRGGGEAVRFPLGSTFAESPHTLGASTFAFGFSRQVTTFGAMDGLDLQDGVSFFYSYADCCPGGSPLEPAFERDLLEQRVAVDFTRDVFAFVGHAGLTERLDLSVTVPVVKVHLEARILSLIQRTATANSPEINRFDLIELQTRTSYTSRTTETCFLQLAEDPSTPCQPASPVVGGAAHGLGDIRADAKLRLSDAWGGGLALVGGVHLPSGDEAELLGTGKFGGRIGAVGAASFGRVGVHGNGSYRRFTGATGARPPDEVAALGGVDVRLLPWLGVSGDVILRNLLDAARVEAVSTVFPSRSPGPQPSASFTAPNDLRVTTGGSPQQLLAAIGAKVLLGGPGLLHVDVMLPIKDSALTPQVGVVAGLSYTF